MPLHDLGGGCYKWGDKGHKYCGDGAKKKALMQGLAEEGEDKFKSMVKKSKANLSTQVLLEIKRLLQENAGKSKKTFAESVAGAFENLDPTKAYISEHEREKIPDEDFAGPGRSFPIRNEMDVHNAAHLIGHSSNPNKVKQKIIEIAKRKGIESALPEAWK